MSKTEKGRTKGGRKRTKQRPVRTCVACGAPHSRGKMCKRCKVRAASCAHVATWYQCECGDWSQDIVCGRCKARAK